MTHRLATNYAKNYCNRTPIVKVIVENVVTCFLGGHSVCVFEECGQLVQLIDGCWLRLIKKFKRLHHVTRRLAERMPARKNIGRSCELHRWFCTPSSAQSRSLCE